LPVAEYGDYVMDNKFSFFVTAKIHILFY